MWISRPLTVRKESYCLFGMGYHVFDDVGLA